MDTATDAEHSRIFDDLTKEERLICLGAARKRCLTRGEWIARQGEPAVRFYLVESGALKIIQSTAEGVDLIVRFGGAGGPFGGVAVEATQAYAWNSADLRAVLDRFPRVRLNIVREMTTHMTDALTRVRELTTQRVGQRGR